MELIAIKGPISIDAFAAIAEALDERFEDSVMLEGDGSDLIRLRVGDRKPGFDDVEVEDVEEVTVAAGSGGTLGRDLVQACKNVAPSLIPELRAAARKMRDELEAKWGERPGASFPFDHAADFIELVFSLAARGTDDMVQIGFKIPNSRMLHDDARTPPPSGGIPVFIVRSSSPAAAEWFATHDWSQVDELRQGG